jgi:hypothetical protein
MIVDRTGEYLGKAAVDSFILLSPDAVEEIERI